MMCRVNLTLLIEANIHSRRAAASVREAYNQPLIQKRPLTSNSDVRVSMAECPNVVESRLRSRAGHPCALISDRAAACQAKVAAALGGVSYLSRIETIWMLSQLK